MDEKKIEILAGLSEMIVTLRKIITEEEIKETVDKALKRGEEEMKNENATLKSLRKSIRNYSPIGHRNLYRSCLS